jgi:hypothetical protein
MVYTGRLKFFAEASALFKHAVFQLVICTMSFSECILQGSRKMEILRALNQEGLYGG